MKTFTLRDRLKSIGFALEGLITLFKSQPNMFLHLLATIFIIINILCFRIKGWEFAALLIVTCMVWAAEIFNTAIEMTMDLVTTDYNPVIKKVKDISAAAVLICAITSIVIGLYILLPKFIVWLA